MDQTTVPLHIARLIFGSMNQTLSTSENQELDDWIDLSEENSQIFDKLTEGFGYNDFDPQEFIEETEMAIELWIIAGLFVRVQMNVNTEEELSRLLEWISLNNKNKINFRRLQNREFMRNMINWIRDQNLPLNN